MLSEPIMRMSRGPKESSKSILIVLGCLVLQGCYFDNLVNEAFPVQGDHSGQTTSGSIPPKTGVSPIVVASGASGANQGGQSSSVGTILNTTIVGEGVVTGTSSGISPTGVSIQVRHGFYPITQTAGPNGNG